ncbi:hypothetical protein H2204_012894 [Knufia peltigerae]|uniref:Uncharacterized protein n=1 Tax=Knufia peltigerae TaxID=1002370 RepID=A0AA38XRJ2_9EURO|nr:hypothetical protein H2204_012894 [Knufia peltigerae]
MDDSLAILATRSERGDIYSDPEARKLASRLDGFPFALATAGAYLSQSKISFGQYLQRYEERWKVMDSMEEPSDRPSRTLYTACDVSFKLIEQENPRAAHLLRFLAYLDHQDIWFELFQGGRPGDTPPPPTWFQQLVGGDDASIFDDTMRVLVCHCLVVEETQQHDEESPSSSSSSSSSSYRLHTCVHDWTLNGLNRIIDTRLYWLAFDLLTSHFTDKEEDCRSIQLSAPRYQHFTGHVLRLAHERFDDALWREEAVMMRTTSMTRLSLFLGGRGHYSPAKRIQRRVLTMKGMTLGTDDPSTLDSQAILGLLYNMEGRLKLAGKLYERVLVGKRGEKAPGVDQSSSIFETLDELGGMYVSEGKLDTAERMFEMAMAEREGMTSGVNDDRWTTTCGGSVCSKLARLYLHQGRVEEAEVMFGRGERSALFKS